MQLHNPVDKAALVPVPGGSFVMGSDRSHVRKLWLDNGWDQRWFNGQVGGADWIGELLPHEVHLDQFWIYRESVTVGQYYQFMIETGHPAPIACSAGRDHDQDLSRKPIPGFSGLCRWRMSSCRTSEAGSEP